MKSLYENLRFCKKEEEVKSEFCKFFKMKINALRGIDHYTEHVLFEFKFDRNFKLPENIARTLAQVMYYARLLKYGSGLTRYPLPPYICVVDRNEAFFAETKEFSRFYTSQTDRYDWDRAPSTPCPNLVADILKSFDKTKTPYIYDLTNPAEESQFVAKCREHLIAQMTFLDLLEKKTITEENFLDVFEYWDGLFGDYVRNGRKSSEYFFADIETGKSIMGENGQVLFSVSGAEGYIPKTLQMQKYRHFWGNYEKVQSSGMLRIRQKADRLTEDFRRRFTGEFYTPVEFAAKGLDYLERTVGKEWWKSGEYRFWDMAAGTGNLEFELPSSALPYCYISTLEAEDAKYCQKIFPSATCFQYDYLADDIPALAGQMTFGQTRKMPQNLVADLANPKLKWIVFINPPFATANTAKNIIGKKSKDSVSKTTLREWMVDEGLGESSRELYIQFLFRIAKEFKNKKAHLCMFSTLKYLNSNNDQKVRDGFFQYAYERGFIFPIKCFHGATGNFPVGFLVWNLSKVQHLSKQIIKLDVFNKDVEKVGTKVVPSVERNAMLNKWCPRPKWDGKTIMPMFSSALKQQTENKDKRDHVAPDFLCSLASLGDDIQHVNAVFLLSAPFANAGAFSVTPENFEKAMVLHAVKKLPQPTWSNNRDAFYAPNRILQDEFIADCVAWSAFANSNNCASLRNIQYQGKTWQIANNMYPFLLEDVRRWPCGHGDVAAQIGAANEDRFLARWLSSCKLSPEARAVMSAAEKLYAKFYAEICNTSWMDWKIETWDVGIYQIRQALKAAGIATDEISALKEAHDNLRAKLLPQIYDYGFLNADVEYFA